MRLSTTPILALSVALACVACSATGSSAIANAIYPLEVGREWTYDVQPIGAGYSCPEPHKAVTLKKVTLSGRDTYEVTYFCSRSVINHLAKRDDGGVDAHYDDTGWVGLASGVLAEGHTWASRFSTFVWHKEGTVTVPAGTFAGCWRAVQQVSFTSWIIYCPGVGPVVHHLSDLNGSGYDAKLVSKNF